MEFTLTFLLPLIIFFILLGFGMPVAFAIGFAGLLGTTMTVGVSPALGLAANLPFGKGASFVLTTIPMFMLMAEMAKQSGIAGRLFELTERFVGHIRGGLGIATVMASVLLAAISGSSVASAAAMATTAAESLEERGYSTKLAMGIVTTAGTISTMVPPALTLIIFGVLTETSIAALFIAGVIPGILTSLAYSGQIYLWAWRDPSAAPRSRKYSWRERMSKLGVLSPVVIISLIVIGGMYWGIMTPTEAGGVGAVSTFLVAFAYREMNWKILNSSLAQTVKTSVMVLIIIICSHFFGVYLATTGITGILSNYVSTLAYPPFVLMLLVVAPYFVLGFFMSGLAAMVILIPLTFPLLESLGYSPLWQGIIVTKFLELGLVTPPFGVNVFVAAGARGISPDLVFRGVIPFVLSDGLVLLFLMIFPDIVTFLPELVGLGL